MVVFLSQCIFILNFVLLTHSHIYIHTHTKTVAAEAEERAKAGAAAAGDGGAEAMEKLDPREIKKMSGPKLKECLKERGLSTQGQKKDLVDRLVAHETGGKK